jgi:hypothetical protein
MHDIFISHSVKDGEVSHRIYTYLEAKGIKCFMDARDLLPGKPYPGQLAGAIRGSQAVVLVFSSSSDISEPVQNEIGLARNNKIPIIPVRIENVVPQELALFITTSQWLDAFPPPIEKHLPKLVNAIKTYLGTKQKTKDTTPKRTESQPQPRITNVIADQDWHDIDYNDLANWVKGKVKLLDTGKTISGRTFFYRRNRYTGKYQRKLKKRP